MARAHHYELLPHVDALLALVEQADAPELLFREVVGSLACPCHYGLRPFMTADRLRSWFGLEALCHGPAHEGRAVAAA